MARTLGAEPNGGAKGSTPPPPGHNGLTDETFLLFVNELAQIEAKLDEWKGQRKSARKRAKAAGIDLGHMDAVVRMADWSTDEVREFFGTRTKYALWMRLPLGAQADMFADEQTKPVEEPQDAAYWSGKGYQAGVRGLVLKIPAECHPQHHQDFTHGYHAGQAKLAPKKLEPVKAAGAAGKTLETVN